MAGLGRCRSVDEYERLNRIGQGTYGTVYRAREKTTGQIVALKRVILHNEEQDGFPLTALREMKLLQRLNHPNCVKLLDVVVGVKRSCVFLVFEYCEHDIANLIDTMKTPFSVSEIKRIMIQILSAVRHLHDMYIIHRDLKMSNLLYNRFGLTKVADFGLAREFGQPPNPMTPKVVTLWYRAPEVLLGCDKYTTAIDLWACGCIFGELLLHEPLFPGRSEMEQLRLIYKLLGSPTGRLWPTMNQLPHADALNFDPSCFLYNKLAEKLPEASKACLDLLNDLLMYDPEKRITAAEALQHPFFNESPYPKDESMMPTFPSQHDSMKDDVRPQRDTFGDRFK